MSIKQGIKYDSPESARDIPAFIEFHKLNVEEMLYPVEHFSACFSSVRAFSFLVAERSYCRSLALPHIHSLTHSLPHTLTTAHSLTLSRRSLTLTTQKHSTNSSTANSNPTPAPSSPHKTPPASSPAQTAASWPSPASPKPPNSGSKVGSSLLPDYLEMRTKTRRRGTQAGVCVYLGLRRRIIIGFIRRWMGLWGG